MSTPKPVSVVYYPAPTTPLTRDEMQEVFAKIGRHDALWQALTQLLQERLAQATVDAAQGEAHAPGRLQELLALQQTFAAWRQHKPKAV
jgi:hypothetical protein